MTVIDSRVISILAKRAPHVTVVQAQNICTDMADQGIIPGLVVPPVDNSFVNAFSPVDDYDNDPSPEEVEKLCDEARKQRPKAVDGFTADEAIAEIQRLDTENERLRTFVRFVYATGQTTNYKYWLENNK